MPRGASQEAVATAVSPIGGLQAADRLLAQFAELEDLDAHLAAVLRETEVADGGPEDLWEAFVDVLDEVVKDRGADVQRILEETSQGLSGRPFKLLAQEFEHLVSDYLASARDQLPLSKRAERVANMWGEFQELDPAAAQKLGGMAVHYRNPLPGLQGGVTFREALEAIGSVSAPAWLNIESDPNGLAAVMLRADLGVMERELQEQLREHDAVNA